jgi:3-oxoacyl-[acyl-carrier protein] reductase
MIDAADDRPLDRVKSSTIEGLVALVVIPGTIVTPAMRRELSPKAIRTRISQLRLGRLSHPSEQADAAVLLASPVASFITGQTFIVDCGFSLNLYPQPMGMAESLREQRVRQHALQAAGA